MNQDEALREKIEAMILKHAGQRVLMNTMTCIMYKLEHPNESCLAFGCEGSLGCSKYVAVLEFLEALRAQIIDGPTSLAIMTGILASKTPEEINRITDKFTQEGEWK